MAAAATAIQHDASADLHLQAEEPTLLEILTDQIVKNKISVADARQIVLRRAKSKNVVELFPVSNIRTVRDLENAERNMIFQVLRENDGSVRAAARSMGMRATTLYRKLRKIGYQL